MSEFEGQEIQLTAAVTREVSGRRMGVLLASVAATTMGVVGLAAVSGEGSAAEEAGVAESTEHFAYAPYCLDGPINVAVEGTAESDQDITVDGVTENLSMGEVFIFDTGEDNAGTIVSSLGSSASFAISESCEFVDPNPTTTTTEATTTTTPDDQVCDPLDSGKIDVVGDEQSVEYTAPEGYLVDAFCVKAGNDLDFKDIDPDQKTVIITDQDDTKDVSHYSVKLVKTPEVTTTTTEATTTTTPNTTTTTTTPNTTTTTPNTTTTTTTAPPTATVPTPETE